MHKSFAAIVPTKSSTKYAPLVIDSRPETNGEYSLFRNLSSCFDLTSIAIVGAKDDFYYIETSPSSEFLLVEPNSQSLQKLIDYARKKNFPKIKFSSDFLWSMETTIELYQGGTSFPIKNHQSYRDDIASGVIIDPYYENDSKQAEIVGTAYCKTFSQVINEVNFGNIDFLKIDIEGAEYEVLKNFSNLSKIKFIQYEYNTMWRIAGVSHELFWNLFPMSFYHYLITPDRLVKLTKPHQQFFYCNIIATSIDFGEMISFI